MSTSFIRWIWATWETIFRWAWRVHPIGNPDEDYLFFVSLGRYLGKPFEVDGVTVRRFDPIIELHMNNQLLLKTLREQKTLVGVAVKLLQEAKHSFPVLAEYVSQGPYQRARVLFGITFIHRGVERLGFKTFPLHWRPFQVFATWHLKNVFSIVNPNGKQMLQEHPDVFVPKLIAISKERLLSQHGHARSPQRGTPDHVLV